MYLLDANVLSRLKPEQRRSNFVIERCRVPEEVLYEVRGLPDIEDVERLGISPSRTMLERLRDVMASIAPEDHTLIDLYRDRGGGDPILIATALAEDRGHSLLWATVWHVVSDDKAVRATASLFDVPSLSRAEFVKLIDR